MRFLLHVDSADRFPGKYFVPITHGFFCPTISGQPRRAGDWKFETDPFEALRCSGWFGSFFMLILLAPL
ncbi:MAG: hypothetical protein QM760_05870 [Nibricoccus sp.]